MEPAMTEEEIIAVIVHHAKIIKRLGDHGWRFYPKEAAVEIDKSADRLKELAKQLHAAAAKE